MSSPHSRLHHQAVSLQQAAQSAPVLDQLMQHLRLSEQCAQAVADLIPPKLHAHIRFGAVLDGQWCVLVSHNAAAARLRQLLPLWQQALHAQQLPVQHIRIKILEQPLA